MQRILDVACGSKMFWFQKDRADTVYMDNRQLEDTLCDGRKLVIKPDIIADFRDMPFKDNTFYLVVFDPPHLIRAGEKSWLAKKYGKLNEDTWQDDIKQGFNECMRVLKPNGTLIFKWNEDQIKLKEILRYRDHTCIYCEKYSRIPEFGKCPADKTSIYKCANMKMITYRKAKATSK